MRQHNCFFQINGKETKDQFQKNKTTKTKPKKQKQTLKTKLKIFEYQITQDRQI